MYARRGQRCHWAGPAGRQPGFCSSSSSSSRGLRGLNCLLRLLTSLPPMLSSMLDCSFSLINSKNCRSFRCMRVHPLFAASEGGLKIVLLADRYKVKLSGDGEKRLATNTGQKAGWNSSTNSHFYLNNQNKQWTLCTKRRRQNSLLTWSWHSSLGWLEAPVPLQ